MSGGTLVEARRCASPVDIIHLEALRNTAISIWQ